MRITISFDSATTAEVRALARSMHRIGRTAELTIGLNGPEKWCGSTPPLPRDAAIAAMIGTRDRLYDGEDAS